MTKHTILFLAANPTGTSELALGEEARAIHAELERSGHRDCFDLQTRWAAQPLDLLRELRKLRPTVVHFSGHRGRSPIAGPVRGLYFQGPDGRPQAVTAQALQDTFGAAGASVQLVVLSACHSDAQAEQLRAHVDCVIGMMGTVSDAAARNFAIGLYGGLGERESIAAAFRQGCAAISLKGLPDRDRPQLKVRPGIDADRLFLAATHAAPAARPQGELQDYLDPRVRPLRNERAAPTLAPTSRDQVRDVFDIGPDHLRYSSQWLDFVGRARELQSLHTFVDSQETFSWWCIVGPGGSGKSRLAQQLGHQLDGGWTWGFLETSQVNDDLIQSARTWQPQQPMLIIIDYAARDILVTQRLLLALCNRPLGCRVRILLLERWSSSWESEQPPIWWQKLTDLDSHLHMDLMGTLHRPEPLTLGPLGEGEHAALQAGVHARLDSPTGLITGDADSTLEEMLPLFAILAAIAQASGEPILHHADTLLEWWYTREKSRLERSVPPPIPADYDVIALATLCGGLDLRAPGTREAVASIYAHQLGHLESEWPRRSDAVARITGSSPLSRDSIAPIEPDRNGEYFLVRHLLARGTSLAQVVFKHAWWLRPNATLGTLERITSAFLRSQLYGERIVGLLLETAEEAGRDARYVASEASMEFLSHAATPPSADRTADILGRVTAFTERHTEEHELTDILADMRAYMGIPESTVDGNPAQRQTAGDGEGGAIAAAAIASGAQSPRPDRGRARRWLWPRSARRPISGETAPSDWTARQLCPDGACIGVIGPDGRCKVCGRSATEGPVVADAAAPTAEPASCSSKPRPDLPEVSNDPIKIPDIILVLPLREQVVSPGAIVSLKVGRPRSVALVKVAVLTRASLIGLLAQRDPLVQDPEEGDLLQIGCVARVLEVDSLPRDIFTVKVQGIARFEIVRYVQREPYLKAHIRIRHPNLPEVGNDPIEIPELIPILPLRNCVVFPEMTFPCDVGRPHSVALVEATISTQSPFIGILLQRNPLIEEPYPDEHDLFQIGCVARILKAVKSSQRDFSVKVKGIARFEIVHYVQRDPYLKAHIRLQPNMESEYPGTDSLAADVMTAVKDVIKLMPELPADTLAKLGLLTDPSHIADHVTSQLELEPHERQNILETFAVPARLKKVRGFLDRQLTVLRLRQNVNTRVQADMNREQAVRRQRIRRERVKVLGQAPSDRRLLSASIEKAVAAQTGQQRAEYFLGLREAAVAAFVNDPCLPLGWRAAFTELHRLISECAASLPLDPHNLACDFEQGSEQPVAPMLTQRKMDCDKARSLINACIRAREDWKRREYVLLKQYRVLEATLADSQLDESARQTAQERIAEIAREFAQEYLKPYQRSGPRFAEASLPRVSLHSFLDRIHLARYDQVEVRYRRSSVDISGIPADVLRDAFERHRDLLFFVRSPGELLTLAGVPDDTETTLAVVNERMPALRARCWFANLNFDPAVKAIVADCGLRLYPPDDLVFHPARNMWLRSTGTEATIGLMDVLKDEQVTSVELPRVNSRCHAGETLATVKTSRRELMLSPHVDVTIQSRNDVVSLIPDVVRVDPYGKGWLVSVRHASPRTKEPITAGLLTWAQVQDRS